MPGIRFCCILQQPSLARIASARSDNDRPTPEDRPFSPQRSPQPPPPHRGAGPNG